jgi:small subunit ribosomal protein S20
MPITRGAEKAHRGSLKKRVFNIRRKSAMHDAVKKVQKTILAGDVAGAEKMLPITYQAIDKAAKRGVIKSNTAARKKSRLIAAIKRAKG